MVNDNKKIEYFVNGFDKAFLIKEKAFDYAKSLGVPCSQVSMIVPPELTQRIVHKEN